MVNKDVYKSEKGEINGEKHNNELLTTRNNSHEVNVIH